MSERLSRNEFMILEALASANKDSDVESVVRNITISHEEKKSVIESLNNAGMISAAGITEKGFSALEPFEAKRAVFMAAGFGSRMVPITLNTPKPLVRVGGERIIDGLIDACLKAGIEEIYVIRGYLAEQFDQLLYKYPQNTPYHIYDIWEHTLVSVDSIKPEPQLRMTMLLHDIGKPDMHTTDENGIDHFKLHQQVSYEKSLVILKRLKFSKADTEEISTLILYHDLRPTGEKKNTLRLASKYGAETLKRLYDVFRADAMAQNPANLQSVLERIESSERYLDEAVAQKSCLTLKDLAINGNDEKSLGYKGEIIGVILNDILEKIVDGEMPNSKAEMLDYIKSNYEV